MLESGVFKDVEYIQHDVAGSLSTSRLFASGIDTVFHLAAQPISVLSNRFPAETMRVNVDGTRRIVAAAEQAGVGAFILASSACRHGVPNSGASSLKEDDPPASPGFYCYSESKQRAEAAVEGYQMARMIARFVNVYGAGDRHFMRIVPKLLRCFIRGETVELARGGGDTVLDYLYVDDAVDGLVALASRVANRSRSMVLAAHSRYLPGHPSPP
jgi:UDP-glucose 4-epimerase